VLLFVHEECQAPGRSGSRTSRARRRPRGAPCRPRRRRDGERAAL